MTFTIITVGPRAALLAEQVRNWHSVTTAVLNGIAATKLGTPTGSALVLVDDDRQWEEKTHAITRWLAAEQVIVFIAVVHTRPVLNSAAWDSAARLNDLTQTPVIWPVDNTEETITDLLHSYASAMAGWGNHICFDMADLAAIADSPCVGMFGRWQVGGTTNDFAERFGLKWGAPPRAGFLTVRGELDATLAEAQDVVTSVQSHFSADDDFLFTTNFYGAPETPHEALLTVLAGPRQRAAQRPL